MTPGNYSIKVSGYSDVSLSGLVFTNETELFYENKQVSVFILTSKPFYNRGETGKLAWQLSGKNGSLTVFLKYFAQSTRKGNS